MSGYRPPWLEQGLDRPPPMPERSYRGRIAYLYGPDAVETGREWFSVSVHPDGGRTIRAQCEMDDDAVLRDVTYAVGPDWKPLDCFVRLTVGGAFMGSSWFLFGDDFIEHQGFNTADGRISQRIAVPQRASVFGTHPVCLDAWQTTAFDHSRPERVQRFEGAFNCSPLANGASGPRLGRSDKELAFVGETQVTVPAGTYDVHHYQIVFGAWDPIDVWVEPEDRIFVRLAWDVLDARYDLVSLERD